MTPERSIILLSS